MTDVIRENAGLLVIAAFAVWLFMSGENDPLAEANRRIQGPGRIL